MALFFGFGTERPIKLATDVRDYLPEEKKYQYQDGYSMAEAAKAWVRAGGSLPGKIAEIVGGSALNSAHFEYPTIVWGRGMAMTDVMAFSPGHVIAVEAKVNEPLDDKVSVWIDRNTVKNPRSPPYRQGVIARYAAALGVTPASLMDIRYQLLQRTLCAALAARDRRACQAWMIVQCFGSNAGEGHCRNLADFDRYLSLVGNTPTLDGVKVRLGYVSEDVVPDSK
jgi:hypothetical protein